jgi:hypothetical protein
MRCVFQYCLVTLFSSTFYLVFFFSLPWNKRYVESLRGIFQSKPKTTFFWVLCKKYPSTFLCKPEVRYFENGTDISISLFADEIIDRSEGIDHEFTESVTQVHTYMYVPMYKCVCFAVTAKKFFWIYFTSVQVSLKPTNLEVVIEF